MNEIEVFSFLLAIEEFFLRRVLQDNTRKTMEAALDKIKEQKILPEDQYKNGKKTTKRNRPDEQTAKMEERVKRIKFRQKHIFANILKIQKYIIAAFIITITGFLLIMIYIYYDGNIYPNIKNILDIKFDTLPGDFTATFVIIIIIQIIIQAFLYGIMYAWSYFDIDYVNTIIAISNNVKNNIKNNFGKNSKKK